MRDSLGSTSLTIPSRYTSAERPALQNYRCLLRCVGKVAASGAGEEIDGVSVVGCPWEEVLQNRSGQVQPNQPMKLSACGRRFRRNPSVLIAAAARRSLWAIR